jgi:hypothetical protein
VLPSPRVCRLHGANYMLVGSKPKTFYRTRTHPPAHYSNSSSSSSSSSHSCCFVTVFMIMFFWVITSGSFVDREHLLRTHYMPVKLSWRGKQHFPAKRWCLSTNDHGTTSRNTLILPSTAVKNSNLTSFVRYLTTFSNCITSTNKFVTE